MRLTLCVEGTVFVDGPIKIGSGVTNYVGNGAIADGHVTINASVAPRDKLSNEQCPGTVPPGAATCNDVPIRAVFWNGQFGL